MKQNLPTAILKPIEIFYLEDAIGYITLAPKTSLLFLSEINVGMLEADNFSNWFDSTGGLIKRLQIAINLGFVFNALVSKGIHFLELNQKEIFIDEEVNVYIPFIENLYVERFLEPNIYLDSSNITPETPPELANNTASPDLYSDSYIYSVIVFYLLTFTYPYYRTIKEYQKYLKGKFSSCLIYIKDCDINQEHRSSYNDMYLTQYLHSCFSRTFKYGSVDRCSRKTVQDLLKACIISSNLCNRCPVCGDWGYYFSKDKCPICKNTVPHIFKFEIIRNPFISELTDDKARSKISEIDKLIREDGNPDYSYPIILNKENILLYNFYLNEKQRENWFKIRYQLERKNNKYILKDLESNSVITKEICMTDFETLDKDDIYRGEVITTFTIK